MNTVNKKTPQLAVEQIFGMKPDYRNLRQLTYTYILFGYAIGVSCLPAYCLGNYGLLYMEKP